MDKESAELMSGLRALLAPGLYDLPVADLRARLSPPHRGPALPVAEVRDISIDGPAGPLRLRLFRPTGGLLPGLLWLRGGWFVLGSLEHSDHLYRELALRTGCLLVAVDFRSAPEHPYPAAIEDCTAALAWVNAHADELGCDPTRIAVGGDSSGGTLAAALCQVARDRGLHPPALQLLVYPFARLRVTNPEYKDLPVFPAEAAERFWALYCTPEQRDNPYVSPGCASELHTLPPAVVLTAEYDCTRDDAEEYAHRLAQAGVRTTLRRCEGSFHGFLGLTAVLTSASAAMDDIAIEVRRILGLDHLAQR
ncbi:MULTISPECIES: alpha/beta hydrolase [unclassified Frankia]|uniref:alpha/beta hydrolase n=1 Tax=unclassified Frankia TaxID=2632575 RepID=UPI001EE4111E|nr:MULTISPECIES: alpha/beta hydrolase [unclassified Frankia]